MTTQTYKTVAGHEVTDTMLEAAAKLFSENYGIWEIIQVKQESPLSLVHADYDSSTFLVPLILS
ncbi:hypothetical protein N7519_006487 [Penicillium mononematosum]|uniref:uncharacterized protein n=1 Tax=Penicillium mononematosum TaxID=268346 RepID=UPI00254692D9|nr:uncharacterized protein N7519_006487 [Penicillium mononematosum]KAJ6185186.1 hypothetical protein N7519_006487 [Penicillium mononematosum]